MTEPNSPGWRWGRRATFLALFGGLYVLVGVSVLLVDLDRFGNVPLVGPVLDSPGWGWPWLIGGLAALVTAARGRARTGQSQDGLGFAALLVPSGLWVIFYSASVISYLATGVGRLAGVAGLLAYGFTWSVILLCAGWPDAPVRTRAER